MFVEFSKILSGNNLFLDYINNFQNVSNYYKNNFRNENSYEEIFNKICQKDLSHRNELVQIIKDQYKNLKPSNKTLSNINLINEKNCIAIFTGQQLGILGGPLYTIYKIFTTIKLSEYLNENFKSFKFVPIFWMAGDDHDFEEIKSINIIDKNNELASITYEDGLDINLNRGSVGNLLLNLNINQFNTKIKELIRETEFSHNFFTFIEEILKEGKTVAESFQELLFRIFDETGLIIFNPQDVEVKKLLKPIFIKELNDYKKHLDDLLITSADLDEHYHAQVKIKPINLFFSDDTGRNLIEPIDAEYRFKNKRKRITKEEILNMVEQEPERFSANVLLRPICQDYLFPTGFYVAGPSEISYFAQISPLYKHYNIQQPFIYPRASATIVEGNVAKILMKFNLSINDFLSSDSNIKERVIQSVTDQNLEEIFNHSFASLNNIFDNLINELTSIDINLKDVINNSAEKMSHQLNLLKSKAIKAQELKYEASLRQITKVQNSLLPNGNLQERELGITNFVTRYGMDFFDWIYNELEIHEFKHQILEI